MGAEAELGLEELARLVAEAPVGEVGALARRLPGAASWMGAYSDDERAAEHYRVFHHELMPVSSVVLAVDGSVGGEPSQRVLHEMSRAGQTANTRDRPPDHLADELLFVARADLETGSRFTSCHMAGWIPQMAEAVRRLASPMYTALMDRIVELLAERVLAGDVAPSPEALLTPLPEIEDPVDDPDASLTHIARFLGAPARSGLLLTRSDIAGLGRERRLPRGFGSRVRMIESLLRAAAEYDEMTYLGEALRRRVTSTRSALEASPLASGIWIDAWAHRLAVTERLADRLAAFTPVQ